VQEATHLKPLTALRFFAAMWVVLFHYWPNLAVSQVPHFVNKGYLGVELFFVLSGFILCHVYLPPAENDRFSYGKFLWARLARVYPMHLATLLGVGALAIAAGVAGMSVDSNILAWQAIPAQLMMTHAWGFAHQAGWNHPSWSISAEWFAYLTFPFFAWMALKARGRPWAALAATGIFLAGLYAIFPILTGFPLTEATIAWGALRIVPCFALGCATYLLWRKSPLLDRGRANFGAVALTAGLVGLAAISGPDTLLVLGFGALIFMLASLTASGSKAFSHPFLVYLGEISYSLYMVCVPWKLVFVNGATKVLGIEGDRLPPWLWAMFLVSVVGVAAVSYHLIERPAREAMRRLAERREARRLAAA